MTVDSVTINLDGRTLTGIPADLAAILAALPTTGTARPARRSEPAADEARQTRKVRSTSRKARGRRKVTVPALPEMTDTYLRSLYAVGPEIPVAGRGALIAAHLLDEQEHTSSELQNLLGVHHQTVTHTLIRLRQGGCQIEVDGNPIKAAKVRLPAHASIRVTQIGTVPQARRALSRYAPHRASTAQAGKAKVSA